jgi:hypothetical protein
MNEIEARLELLISHFDSALFLEKVFINSEENFDPFFVRCKWLKKAAQKELRNLKKRLATAHKKSWHEKHGKEWSL